MYKRINSYSDLYTDFSDHAITLLMIVGDVEFF